MIKIKSRNPFVSAISCVKIESSSPEIRNTPYQFRTFRTENAFGFSGPDLGVAFGYGFILSTPYRPHFFYEIMEPIVSEIEINDLHHLVEFISIDQIIFSQHPKNSFHNDI